jgi:integrase
VSVYPTTVAAVQGALAYACKRAGVQPFGPHRLRDLHISRCIHHGWLSPAEVAARVGHTSPAITLSTYTHLVPPD